MAFLKRTWLARIGTGLNKFIIGNKDGEGKQTLTNAPDSVTQQGDVISAENLNDLEDRIETAVNANENAIRGMKLTKIWENPTPSASFGATVVEIDSGGSDIVIEYTYSTSATQIRFMKWIPASQVQQNSPISSRLDYSFAQTTMSIHSRIVSVSVLDGEYSVSFDESYGASLIITSQSVSSATIGKDNTKMIPLIIYKVGDIYNS